MCSKFRVEGWGIGEICSNTDQTSTIKTNQIAYPLSAHCTRQTQQEIEELTAKTEYRHDPVTFDCRYFALYIGTRKHNI
jgi:hypothetical protein